MELSYVVWRQGRGVPSERRDLAVGLCVEGGQLVRYRCPCDDEEVCGVQVERGCEPLEQWWTGYGAVEYCLELGFGYPGPFGQVAGVEFPVVRQSR